MIEEVDMLMLLGCTAVAITFIRSFTGGTSDEHLEHSAAVIVAKPVFSFERNRLYYSVIEELTEHSTLYCDESYHCRPTLHYLFFSQI
jgi:hypothetical protein